MAQTGTHPHLSLHLPCSKLVRPHVHTIDRTLFIILYFYTICMNDRRFIYYGKRRRKKNISPVSFVYSFPLVDRHIISVVSRVSSSVLRHLIMYKLYHSKKLVVKGKKHITSIFLFVSPSHY